MEERERTFKTIINKWVCNDVFLKLVEDNGVVVCITGWCDEIAESLNDGLQVYVCNSYQELFEDVFKEEVFGAIEYWECFTEEEKKFLKDLYL